MYFLYYNFSNIIFGGDYMSKKKTLIILLLSTLALLLIILSIFLIFTLFKPQQEKEPILSPVENITVEATNKEIVYFEDFTFIGTKTNDIKKHLQNVMYANDIEIQMNNIKLFDFIGTYTIFLNNDQVNKTIFTSIDLYSANDTGELFSNINNICAKKTKQDVSKIYVVDANKKQSEFTDVSVLYDSSNFLFSSYTLENCIVEITTQYNGEKYNVIITTSS